MDNYKICYVVTIPTTIRAFFIPQLKYLSKGGFKVTVICQDDSMIRDDLGNDISYISVDIPRGISYKKSLLAIKELIKIFKREKFDLVQYSTPNAAFCSSIAAKLCNIPIRNYHLMGLRYLGNQGVSRSILKVLEKFICTLSTHIECVSASNLKMCIEEKLFSSEKGKIVWNGSSGGIDLNRFDYTKRVEYRREIRNLYNLDDYDFIFGFVGRITQDKGINEILEAFSNIKNAKLLLVGDKENIDSLNEELFKESKCKESIIYTGQVDDVERYYSAIDCILLPSYREGFGNVVIEAAAMGTPAIVSNIPGPIDAVIPDVTAKVIPVKSTYALQNAMLEFLQNRNINMGENAAAYVTSHFDSQELNHHVLERKKMILEENCGGK